jgi:hypothetical protein
MIGKDQSKEVILLFSVIQGRDNTSNTFEKLNNSKKDTIYSEFNLVREISLRTYALI